MSKVKTIEDYVEELIECYVIENIYDEDKAQIGSETKAVININKLKQAMHDLVDSCPEFGKTGDAECGFYIAVEQWKKAVKGEE